MENLVDTVIKLTLDEIETYDFPKDKLFGLEVNHENVRYCFMMRLASDNRNLLCLAPAAFARDKKTSTGKLITPPFFARWSWYKYFDESVIAFADPIFFDDDEIRVGWFVGRRDVWYLEVVSEIIKKIAINQEIYNNNILFFGSSAGGFASIGLGTLIKGSKVLVNHSQFNVLNYLKRHVDILFEFLQKDFPELTRLEIEEHLKCRLNMIELFKKENYIPNITYYLNSESKIDFNDHFLPFVDELKELPQFDKYFTVYFYKQTEGKPHNPIDNEENIRILREYMKEYLYNEKESHDNALENNLIKSNESLTKQNRALLSKIDSLQKTNNEVMNSKSWKLTKPLRTFRNLLR